MFRIIFPTVRFLMPVTRTFPPPPHASSFTLHMIEKLNNPLLYYFTPIAILERPDKEFLSNIYLNFSDIFTEDFQNFIQTAKFKVSKKKHIHLTSYLARKTMHVLTYSNSILKQTEKTKDEENFIWFSIPVRELALDMTEEGPPNEISSEMLDKHLNLFREALSIPFAETHRHVKLVHEWLFAMANYINTFGHRCDNTKLCCHMYPK